MEHGSEIDLVALAVGLLVLVGIVFLLLKIAIAAGLVGLIALLLLILIQLGRI